MKFVQEMAAISFTLDFQLRSDGKYFAMGIHLCVVFGEKGGENRIFRRYGNCLQCTGCIGPVRGHAHKSASNKHMFLMCGTLQTKIIIS